VNCTTRALFAATVVVAGFTPGAASAGLASLSSLPLAVDLKSFEITDEGQVRSAAAASAKCSGKGAGWRLATVDELRAMLLTCNDPTNQACRATEGAAASARCEGCGRHKGPYQGAGTKGCYLDLDMYPGACRQFWSSTEVQGSQPKAWWTVDFASGTVEPRATGNFEVKCVKPKPGAVAQAPAAPTAGSGSSPSPNDWDNPPGDPSQGEVCVGQYQDAEACCQRKGKRLPSQDELRSLMEGCNPPPEHVCTPGGHPTRRDGCYLKTGFQSFKGYKCGEADTVHQYWAADPTPNQQPPAAPYVNVANGYVSARERPYTDIRVGRCVK
jgi:hypothetical protein